MKPTISNAFNDGSADRPNNEQTSPEAWELRQPQSNNARSPRNPRKSLAASLAPMQVDLRETDFGWSLELSPIQAADAVRALTKNHADESELRYLVSMEQSSWSNGGSDASIAMIAQRLSIPVLEQFDNDQLVLNKLSLMQLVSLCEPSRLLVTVIDGPIEAGDVQAIERAIEKNQSPLQAELRAVAAIEVMGDRSVVLHCREKTQALTVVAENFRHYLAALRNRPMDEFAAPDPWQIERLLSVTGLMTIRPIETQIFSTSIDVGVNTAQERFNQPADQSLIYDIPSNSWHDEP